MDRCLGGPVGFTGGIRCTRYRDWLPGIANFKDCRFAQASFGFAVQFPRHSTEVLSGAACSPIWVLAVFGICVLYWPGDVSSVQRKLWSMGFTMGMASTALLYEESKHFCTGTDFGFQIAQFLCDCTSIVGSTNNVLQCFTL